MKSTLWAVAVAQLQARSCSDRRAGGLSLAPFLIHSISFSICGTLKLYLILTKIELKKKMWAEAPWWQIISLFLVWTVEKARAAHPPQTCRGRRASDSRAVRWGRALGV